VSYAAFWTASTDGSSWYRADQPAAALTWRGHQTWAQEVLPASVVAKADVIVGSRVSNEGATEQWQRMKTAGKRLVLDLDDDYFAVEERNAHAYGHWSQPDVQRRLIENCTIADVITVASAQIGDAVADELAHWFDRNDPMKMPKWPDVQVIPNGLHAGWLGVARDYDPEVLTIGWAGTSATAHDFDLVVKPLDRIMLYCESIGRKARLSFVGLPRAHPGLHQLGERWPVTWAEWVAPTERYHQAVNEFDIWVAPYRSNSFTEAKFPTKALEAGFMGIPLIASNIAPYREWPTDLRVLDHAPWAWSTHLKALVDSPENRRKVGEAARSRAARNILQDVAGLWEEVLFGG
jgi:glycosyltransferase involved in cell wall biosynthesis